MNLRMSLCDGRHPIPDAVDGSIFRKDISDVTDVDRLDRQAFDGIWNACFKHYKAGQSGWLVSDDDWDGSDAEPLKIRSGLHIDLYVTGLTVALVAVINCCIDENIGLTLWHFNRDTGNYYSQDVTTKR